MATKHLYLKDLHFDYQLWKNELNFYREEIKIFEERLGEVVNRNTDKDVLAQAEHFQNQYIRQRDVADQLVHEVNVRQDKLVAFARENETAVDRQYFDDQADEHQALAQQVATYHKIYQDLKGEFMNYLRQWM